ncbi:MAG TPA: hypothetical protein VN922_16880 [Bacteroidia bacterium]|nr:hypothetical protein [Bacteroidia bacterium]
MSDKPKRNIIFTFDYELFLGKQSGSVYRCVIEPTQKILNIFYELGMSSAIFFVDTLWLIRLKKVASESSIARKDYEMVVQQLQQISRLGHYIFPHLHPHWADAIYSKGTNQWQLINYSRYRVHSLDKSEREQCFGDSVGILKEILGDEYKPLAYRAGGWSIQPFEDFEPLFQKYNVKYDFSVLPGTKRISTGQHYDFSDIKITRPYTFSTDVTVPGKGSYTEFPISMVKVSYYTSLLNRAYLKYLQLNGSRSYGDGQGIVVERTESSADNGSEMVSVELLNDVKLPLYLRYLKKNDYMQFISHPKMLTQHNIDTFSSFVKRARRAYKVNTDFMKLQPEN